MVADANESAHKITAIKQQVRNTGRYSVYVGGSYLFSLSESELLAQKIRVGQTLSGERQEELRRISGTDKLYERCLMLIARRMRSTHEIRQYLLRKKADADQIETIVSKLTDRGYIDDTVFAAQWAQSRQATRHASSSRLRLELRSKGVSSELIDEVVTDLEQSDEQTIRELISRKRLRQKYPDRQKLMQYLARQGYRYDDIRQVVDEDSASQ
jgi:regulatory protein